MNKMACAIVMFLTLGLSLNASAAEEAQDVFHLGVRPGVTQADGEAANDILSFGLFGRYLLAESWLVGVALDYAEFDFEEPAKMLRLNAAEIVDASTTQYLISAWVEHEFNIKRDWLSPFVGAGLGIGILDTDEVTGPINGGGTFDISTDPGVEFIPSVLVGLRFSLGERIFTEIAAHADYRFASWDVTDRNSGVTATLDDYFTYGAYLGLGVRF